jgi:hypothetical protein
MRKILAVLALALLTPACGGGGSGSGGSTVVPKGARVLGFHVGPATGETYDQAVTVAKTTGMQSIDLSFDWTSIETSAGVFDTTYLDVANTYYPARGLRLFLTLRPINTVAKEVPADLAATAFDNATMISRFNALLDVVFAHLPAVTLEGLAIGNEVDNYLGSSASGWTAFTTFFAQTAAHARTLRPGLKVGCVGTLKGLTVDQPARLQTLNASADIILATHYPMDGGFQFLPPAQVEADLDALVALGYAQPIHVVELGFASGAACGSSEEDQRQFVAHAFAAWDRHAGKIASIYFSWLTDMTSAAATTTAGYYGLAGNPAFVDFIRTLGQRNETGAAKPAFTQTIAEASARGW